MSHYVADIYKSKYRQQKVKISQLQERLAEAEAALRAMREAHSHCDVTARTARDNPVNKAGRVSKYF